MTCSQVTTASYYSRSGVDRSEIAFDINAIVEDDNV